MKKIIFLLLIIISSRHAAAQGTIIAGKMFTLEECLQIAETQNTDIRLANAGIAPAAANLTSAFGSFLPGIYFNMGYSRQIGGQYMKYGGQLVPIPDSLQNSNSYSLGVSASLDLFNGFSREAAYSQAKSNLNYQYRNYDFTLQKIRMDVIRQYTEVIRKSQIVKIRRENLETGRNELDKTRAQYDAGLINVSLVYSQEAEVGAREYDLVTAENEFNIAKAVLLTLLGYNPDQQADFSPSSLPTFISDDNIKDFRGKIGTMVESVSSALNKRHDYSAVKYSIEAAESGIEAASSGYYPTLSLSGGWSWSNIKIADLGKLGNWAIGLNLTMPIFENFRTNYQLKTAEFQLTQSTLQQIQLEQSIRASLHTAYLNLEAAEKQLDISTRSLKAAEMNQQNYKNRYDVGLANITEYYTANSGLVTAQINRVNAVYNYFLAQKEIYFATGNLE